MPEQFLANRYRVLHTLGSGGMGVVYLVEDTRKNNKVIALKTMRSDSADAGADSFRAEFRNIIGVVHPNIPEVYDFGILPPPDSSLYFTTEYVDGQPLDQLPLKWLPAQLHEVLVQVCRALAFLHSRKLLHRDLKPQNVLGRLNTDGQFETLKLVDFGLATQNGAEAAVAGTVDYMAPELIEGRKATVASDIYAAGMMLYRLAAGRLPFAGDDPLAIARQRCMEEAPPPLRFRPDLPVGLSDVISTLIRVKSKERPPTARHVIALLNEREGTDYPYERDDTRSAYIRSATAVTNTHEREELLRRKAQLLTGGSPAHLLVISPRGFGRRRLLHDFAHELAVDGLRVQIAESETDLPSDERVQVFIVPDVERFSASSLSAAVTAACNRHTWCVIGATAANPELAAILGGHDALTLQPLNAEGVEQFVSATFPENTFPAGFSRRLYSGSIGCEVALHRALDYLQEDGILRIGLNGWELLPGSWNIPVHPVLTEFIETTLAELPDQARRLAYHLACSQSPLPGSVLHAALPDDRERDIELADASQALERIGWIEWEDDSCAIVFSAVSEYLESILDDETACEIHHILAAAWTQETLRTHPRQRREYLFHDSHALSWSIAPDEAARTLYQALEDDDLRWVRRLVEFGLHHRPPAAMRDVMLDALTSIEYMEGNLDAAAALLALALQNGEVPVTETNLDRMARYAMIEDKLGRTEHAADLLEKCLVVLPEGHDSRAGIVFGTLAWIAFKHGEAERARKLAEEGLLRVPPHVADTGHATLLNTVASLAFYRGDADAAAMYWKRGLEINEILRDRKGVAHIYNNLGVLAAQSGDRLRARSLWKKCAEIAGEINDVRRLAGIYNNLGVDALETGVLAEAEEYYLKALGLFRRMKSPREQVEILSNLGELCYYRADFPRAHAYLQEAVMQASTLEDYECEIEPLIYLGKLLLTLEELENAAAVLERAYRAASEVGTKKGQAQAWEGIAMLRHRRGRWSGATEALDQARMLLSEDVDPLALLHFHLTECALRAENGDAEKAKEALASARKVADTKWDPFTAARTLVYGLLFAQEELDTRERPRIIRQLSVYPDLLWRYYWGAARLLAAQGAVRKALEEFGRGATVLKSIASRLSERSRDLFLSSPQIKRFKDEAVMLRNSVKES
jgi:tetratricopeptide (TPR) repeat protein/tRNA A-37 threonylcarbamoyl transferase component Bud32